jgi:NADPH:quinone reductase-like Zn-dependent oxidoreductase
MKGIIWSKYGFPEHLKLAKIETLSPEGNEVLVKVKGSSVNRTDCAMFYAKPFFMRIMTGLMKPNRVSLGTEFSRIVEEIGTDVSGFKVGDEVFGLNPNGLRSHAEFLLIKEDWGITLKPANLSFIEAGSCTEGADYALNMLNKVDLKPGEKVLINGATGGIGSTALQLSKYYGAEVTAVGNTKNLGLLKTLGADEIINYEKKDFTKKAAQYDYIFDAVGKSTFGKCKPLLKPNGVYISSELGPWFQNIYFALMSKIRKGKKVVFPVPYDAKTSVFLVKQLMEENKLKPLIDKTYALEEVGDAFKYVSAGQKTGNVAITVQ